MTMLGDIKAATMTSLPLPPTLMPSLFVVIGILVIILIIHLLDPLPVLVVLCAVVIVAA